MSKMIQRSLAWLLALVAVAAFAVAPALAYADDLAAGSLQAQDEDAAPWTTWTDSDVIFTVETQTADGQVKDVEFTKGQLVEMAAANTEPVYYTFTSKGDAVNTVVAEEYVTFDQLFTAASTTFEEGDELICSSAEFTPKSAIAYADFVKARKFFPAFAAGSPTTTPDDVEVPAVVALKWGGVKSNDADMSSDMMAGQMKEAALAKSKHEKLRNFWGLSEEDLASGNTGGNSFNTGAAKLEIHKPFNIYEQDATGAKTLVKSYYQKDIAALAITAAEPQDARGFLFNKNGWQVGATAHYVPVDTLLKDAFGADFALSESQTVVASALDGFSTYLPYEQFVNTKYFYPSTTSAEVVADGAEEVGTVLALTWETTQNPKVANMNGTAGEAKVAIASADADDLVRQYRIFTGLLAADDPNTGGNRFATGPAEITIVTLKDVADESITISGVKASYTYTGEAIMPEVVVKDGDKELALATKKGGDYTVEYGENTAIGQGTVTIKGVNSFTGTKTVTFKINPISIKTAKVTLAKASSAYTGKTQKGAVKSVVLNGKTLSKTSDYSVSAKAGAKVGSYDVTVTGKGIYGSTVKATYKIVKATQAISAKANVAKQFAGKKSGKTKVLAKNQVINLKTLAKVSAKTPVKFAKANKAGAAKIAVSAAGKVTAKKGLAKGTYKVKVKITAPQNANYKAAKTKTITLTITVK